MAWRLAKSLVKLREQINVLYPDRDKSSDGTIGDLRHQNTKSEHNPNKAGVVRATDIDEDVSQGSDAMPIVRALIASRDPRILYIIYEGRMIRSYRAKDGTAPWVWTAYHGANPHKHHFHLSVVEDPKLYDNASDWDLSALGKPEPPKSVQPELRRGAIGEAVKRLQLALRAHGEYIDADGDFGPATEKALKNFQLEKGLRVDGIAGKLTNAALGI